MKKTSNDVWLGKYFLSDIDENVDFIKDFKKILQTNDDFSSKKLYLSSTSVLFSPKVHIKNSGRSILLISHELSRTGAPMVVLDTAKVLIKNGYFVTVISLMEGPLLNDFLEIGIPVIIMPDMEKIRYLRNESFHFLKKMDLDVFVKNYDLTIMVTATLFNFVKRYFNTRYKIIWWIHEGSASYDFLDVYMPKVITPNVKVFCGGQYAINQLQLRGYRYYPRILNYGVFDESKKYLSRKFSNEKVRFLVAGTIGTRKGQLTLVEAINKLEDSYQRQTEFLFVGDVFDGDIAGMEVKKEIENCASLHDNVKLFSSISRDELYELYTKIDVLTLPSIDDPMPVVATENFMLGNVCLCSTNTGTSYYITDGENGFIFETNNDEQLKEKIVYIVDNKLNLKTIRQNGRKIYEDYFDINIFEKNILDIVRSELT